MLLLKQIAILVRWQVIFFSDSQTASELWDSNTGNPDLTIEKYIFFF